ncbi:MAG: DeoR/GlpR family DNA-binding transcription regulator, partial [Anaerolineae bacterium]
MILQPVTGTPEDEVADTLAARGTAERRWSILEQVRRDGQATVTDLSRSFGVSEVSIRRDLERLEEMGYLRRVHGGAQALSAPEPGSIFDARRQQNVAVKQALGRAGAGLIQPGQTILIDAGTTMLELARAIPRPLLQEGGLTIITRSLLIASELRLHHRTRLLILGGIYQHDYDSCIGAGLEQA